MNLKNVKYQSNIEKRIYLKRRKRKCWLKKRNINKHLVSFRNNNCKVLYPGGIIRFLPFIIKLFIKEGYLSVEYAQKTIIAPIDFSFKNQYDESVLFLKSFISSYLLSKGNIVLDFSQCKRGSISTFVQLSILLKELNLALRRFNSGCMYKNYKEVKILPSKDIKILKYLAALNLFNGKELENLDKCDLFLPLKLQRGRQNGVYSENKKGVVGKRMVEFVNEALRANSYELNKKGQSVLRGLIDEVLSNAEDHSLKYSEWFVDGIAFMEKQFGTDVVELNFAILNYGDSMYEGFEKTKEQNINNYNLVNQGFQMHSKNLSEKHQFGKEGLFTMLMLNEGISRLKYKEPSRGNGTMNFLDAFIAIGGFGDDNTNFNSQLNIISGHTCLTCDNNVRPYMIDNIKLIALNKEQNQNLLPDQDYLRDNNEYFPGTILECKIFLNETYFKHILNV